MRVWTLVKIEPSWMAYCAFGARCLTINVKISKLVCRKRIKITTAHYYMLCYITTRLINVFFTYVIKCFVFKTICLYTMPTAHRGLIQCPNSVVPERIINYMLE